MGLGAALGNPFCSAGFSPETCYFAFLLFVLTPGTASQLQLMWMFLWTLVLKPAAAASGAEIVWTESKQSASGFRFFREDKGEAVGLGLGLGLVVLVV